jgi:hypothetical protein
MDINRYDTKETRDEINKVKQKREIIDDLYGKDLIKFYLRYYYLFIRKETRLFIILKIQEYLKSLETLYKFKIETYKTNSEIEEQFRVVSNTIFRTSPDPANIFRMMLQYMDLIVPNNIELSRRIIYEIDALMFQVNKFTQLYYNGDGKGSISYINLYEKAK